MTYKFTARAQKAIEIANDIALADKINELIKAVKQLNKKIGE